MRPLTVVFLSSVLVALVQADDYETTTTYKADAYVALGDVIGRHYGQLQTTNQHKYDGAAGGSSVTFSKDQREAKTKKEKSQGYEYNYRKGHELKEAKELYNYDTDEPIYSGDIEIDVQIPSGPEDLTNLIPARSKSQYSQDGGRILRGLQGELEGVPGNTKVRVISKVPSVNFGFSSGSARSGLASAAQTVLSNIDNQDFHRGFFTNPRVNSGLEGIGTRQVVHTSPKNVGSSQGGASGVGFQRNTVGFGSGSLIQDVGLYRGLIGNNQGGVNFGLDGFGGGQGFDGGNFLGGGNSAGAHFGGLDGNYGDFGGNIGGFGGNYGGFGGNFGGFGGNYGGFGGNVGGYWR